MAELVVLPELPVLELVHLFPELAEEDVPWALAREFGEAYESQVRAIALEHETIVVGGSHFVQREDRIYNVCLTVDGRTGHEARQEKVKLTTYERETWRLAAGESGLVRQPDDWLGVTICYDSEFPESGRTLAERGALVQCVPAFTETRRGFQRVRWCSHARAVENQVFVVHSSLVGSLGREPVPAAVGTSAIICPSVEPFPESAVLMETPWNGEGFAVGRVEFAELEQARSEGEVRNWSDRSPAWGPGDVQRGGESSY